MKVLKYYFVFVFTIFSFQLHAIEFDMPPGVVIHHISKEKGLYIGSPSIVILPNGNYLASHDMFGPKSTEFQHGKTRIYLSSNRGLHWEHLSTLQGQFWSSLFVHKSELYIIGTNRHHGNLIIRKSTDGGKNWSTPNNSENGLLLEGEYHTAPVPIVTHNGRIWRAVEYATSYTYKWGKRYSAMMISASIDSDLLNAANWSKTNVLSYDSTYLNGNFEAWLEGNAVVLPNGGIANILRVAIKKGYPEHVAITTIDNNFTSLKFDASKGFVAFNGGSKKFTIRYDQITRRYWTLTNNVDGKYIDIIPSKVRNKQVLSSSKDLINWTNHHLVLEHQDYLKHAFQYVDWVFDNDDIIFVSRTAFDDESGGAYSAHNANYLTFHRVENFRNLLTKKL